MAAEQVTTNDMKKDKNSDTKMSLEDQPQPPVETEQADDAVAGGSGTNSLPKENGLMQPVECTEDKPSGGEAGRATTGVQISFDRLHEIYVRVSQPTGHESLCTRIRREIEDWPDEEDLLPPVVDFSVEQMIPGWYQSLCASPHCHGDL